MIGDGLKISRTVEDAYPYAEGNEANKTARLPIRKSRKGAFLFLNLLHEQFCNPASQKAKQNKAQKANVKKAGFKQIAIEQIH